MNLFSAKIEKKVNKKIKMGKNCANLSECHTRVSLQLVLLRFNSRNSI